MKSEEEIRELLADHDRKRRASAFRLAVAISCDARESIAGQLESFNIENGIYRVLLGVLK